MVTEIRQKTSVRKASDTSSQMYQRKPLATMKTNKTFNTILP